MTHFIGLVVAENEEELSQVLARFDENFDVAPYFEEMDAESLASMATHYKFEPGDAAAIRAHCEAWTGRQYATTNGLHGSITTRNPQGQWDWYAVGGGWANVFPNHAQAEEVFALFEKYDEPPAVLVDWAGWHATKAFGWFGTSRETEEPQTLIADRLKANAGRRVYFVDFHT